MATELQRRLSAAIKAAKDIAEQVANAKDGVSDELQAQYQSAVKSAEQVKALVENENKLDALKSWSQESDGASVVRGSFAGEALPGEGDIPGVTTDGGDMRQLVVNERMPEEYKSLGAAKLKVLNSGLYKDAFAAKIRAEGLRQRLESKYMKVLQEGLDGSGAEWVPPDMRADVISKIATVPGVYQDVYKFTTGSNQVVFPKVVWTTDDLYTTGIKPAWTAEAPATNITESTNPVSGYESIPVHTMTAAVLVTRAMLEDASFDLIGYISAKLGENIPLFLNNALINGDGVGKPQGFLQHPLATTLWSTAGGGMKVLSTASTNVSFGAVSTTATGLMGMDAVLPPQYEQNAKWYANKKTLGAIRTINVGTANLPVWKSEDFYPNALNGMAPRLLGYPIVKDQFMPDIAQTAYPIALADMKGYYAPHRVGLSIEVLREVFALRDIVAIYARMRVGGQLVEPWRAKVMLSHTS